MIETTTVEAPIIGLSGGIASAATCGFTAIDDGGDIAERVAVAD